MAEQTQKQEKTMRNGVDVIALKETIGTIKNQPELAEFKFRARNKWINCGHNQSTIEGFYGCLEENKHKTSLVYDADEPETLLGEDKGAVDYRDVWPRICGIISGYGAFIAESGCSRARRSARRV